MTDVFIRCHVENIIRYHLTIAAIHRWLEESDINLKIILSRSSMNLDILEFQLPHLFVYQEGTEPFWTYSKQYAEDHAESEIYILADDDQLILGKDWVKRGVETLRKNDKYGLLAAWSINEEQGGNLAAKDDTGFGVRDMSHSSVGAPYFTWKGAIDKLPDSKLLLQDTVLSEHVKSRGYKIGFINKLRYNHLGAYYSTVSENHWNITP